METENEKNGIYYEEQMDRIPEYYDRDIIKVLTKNPLEVFIFWGISQHSFKRIQEFFQSSLHEIQYKLFIRFTDDLRHSHFQEIYLPPFTTSYVLKFLAPVKNLRVEIIAYNHIGGLFSLMHSAYLSMPTNKPSSIVHHDWIHPMWVQEGYLENIEGHYVLAPIKEDMVPFDKFSPQWESTILYDGSSGYSSHAVTSSYMKKKEDY
jgi:hypothetical protein